MTCLVIFCLLCRLLRKTRLLVVLRFLLILEPGKPSSSELVMSSGFVGKSQKNAGYLLLYCEIPVIFRAEKMKTFFALGLCSPHQLGIGTSEDSFQRATQGRDAHFCVRN